MDVAKTIEPFYEALGLRIQKAREHQKMTQAQLGFLLNPPSTRASIANIENGKQRVLLHTFVQLAKHLGLRIQDLIPTNDEAAPGPSPEDVERELRRKLDLRAPQLRDLTAAAKIFTPSRRNKP